MGYKRYSDEQKAAALAALKSNGGNLFRTSHEVKIPLGTLNNWAKDTREPVENFAKLQTEKEEGLAELCETVARKYLNQAGDPHVVSATPGNLAMTAAGIAIDKSRLLREQATFISGTQEKDPVELYRFAVNSGRKGTDLPEMTREEAELGMKAATERSKLKIAS